MKSTENISGIKGALDCLPIFQRLTFPWQRSRVANILVQGCHYLRKEIYLHRLANGFYLNNHTIQPSYDFS